MKRKIFSVLLAVVLPSVLTVTVDAGSMKGLVPTIDIGPQYNIRYSRKQQGFNSFTLNRTRNMANRMGMQLEKLEVTQWEIGLDEQMVSEFGRAEETGDEAVMG